MEPTFSIIHPSARPGVWRGIYNEWIAAADDPAQVEYLLVVTEKWGFSPDTFLIKETFDGTRPRGLKLVWPQEEPNCYVTSVNSAASCSTGQILIVIADDQHPAPHWDTAILKFIESWDVPGYYNGDQFIISVDTNTPNEHERGITVMPIISRARYEHLGYIFYPRYESMYADNDLTAHAKKDFCLYVAGKRLPIFPHVHPINTPGLAMDEAYYAQNRPEAYRIGEAVFYVRQQNGFQELTDAQLPVARKTIAVCLPGEVFSSTWLSAWTGLFVNLFTQFNVIPIFCHTSNVHVTRGVLAKQVLQQTQGLGSIVPDYVLWIDDDNPVHWEHVAQLLSDLDHVPEADVVCGWCWIWNELGKNFIASCGYLKESDATCNNFTHESFQESQFDLIEIGFTGFPLVLMRMSTLSRLFGTYPHPFAPIMDDAHPWGAMSEDTAFCRRMANLGMKMFVDRRVRVDHLKTVAYGPETRYGLESVPAVTTNLTTLPAAEHSNPVLAEK